MCRRTPSSHRALYTFLFRLFFITFFRCRATFFVLPLRGFSRSSLAETILRPQAIPLQSKTLQELTFRNVLHPVGVPVFGVIGFLIYTRFSRQRVKTGTICAHWRFLLCAILIFYRCSSTYVLAETRAISMNTYLDNSFCEHGTVFKIVWRCPRYFSYMEF